MGINVGNLNASLTLQSAQFMASMKAAAQQSQATSRVISNTMNFAKGAVLGLAGAFSVDMFAHVIKGAFDFVDAIQDLSDRTGASTKFIQEFGYAAQISGSSVENARTGIEKFAKNLGEANGGNQELLKTFKALGVTSNDTDTAIRQTADGISKIDNKAQQAATTVKLFGKTGQDLVATLSGGAAGLDDWAKKAQELGIVIDAKLISNAGKVNDKLDTMKMILDAKMASAIVENADAIGDLADNFLRLASAAMEAVRAVGNNNAMWNMDHPGLANFSSRLFGGDAGKDRQADYQHLLSNKDGRDALLHRNTQALNALNTADKGGGLDSSLAELSDVIDNPQSRYAAERRLMAQRKQILAAYKPIADGGGHDGSGGGDLPGLTKKDDHAAEKAAKAQKAFDAAMLSEQLSIYGLRQQMQVDPRLNANLKHDSVNLEYGFTDANGNWNRGAKQGEIDDELKGGTFGDPKSKLAQARAEQLKQQLDINGKLQHSAINRDLDIKLDQEDLATKKASIANDNDILQGAMGLARTQQERRSLQLKMLDNQYEQQRVELEATIASKEATEAEKDIARARLKVLGTLKGQDQQAVIKQTMGPMASYLDSMPKTLGEISESVEGIAAEGFAKLNDSIADAIMGAGSLKDAFGDMAKFVISSLIKIAVQQAIIKPIASALFGGATGGGLGGIIGSIIGHRANGGMTAPGMYQVGERGPEVINVGQSSSVVTSRELNQMGAANDNGRAINISFGNITSNDPAAIKLAAYQAIAEAAPMLRQQAVDATMTKLRRPNL